MGRPTLMILRTYHMANPGADAVNFQADDVLSPKRQEEIQQVVEGLETFRATKIALEISEDSDPECQDRYQKYLNGTYHLSRDERDQLGFRLAKRLGHSKVYPVDWNKPAVPGLNVDFETFAAEHGQKSFIDEALEIAQHMAEQGEDYQARASILDLLRSGNDPKNLLQMHRPYFKIARIGLGNEYPGANWVQHWYGRNLKIFVNLTRIVDSEDERILLIIGSGHAWLLRQFAQEDGFFKLEEPIDYL